MSPLYNIQSCVQQPLSPPCLYFSFINVDSISGSYNTPLIDIDGVFYTLGGLGIQYIGTDLQNQYNINTGGFTYLIGYTQSEVLLWGLFQSAPTNWLYLDYGTSLFNIANFNLINCDTSTTCYYVDIPFPSPVQLNVLTIHITGIGNIDIGIFTDDLNPTFPYQMKSIFGANIILTSINNGGSYYLRIDNCYKHIYPKKVTTTVGLGSYNFKSC